jgi:hypothetical protein
MKNIALTEWDLRPHMDRFTALVRVRPKACWYWTGAKNSKGAGTFALTRAAERHSRSVYAHRLAMFYFAGRLVTPEEDVRHTCGRRDCCNPDHLKVVPNVRMSDED